MKLSTLTLVFVSLCGIKLQAETINDWLLAKIQEDEQIWVKSINRIDGYQFEVLQFSKFYVPFFMELPDVGRPATGRDSDLLHNWKQQEGNLFLPGGYVFRLKFKAAPSLYAVSAGEWTGNTWHSINLEKDVEIEPGNTWEGSSGDYPYATLLPGVRPRLISYNQSGEVAHQETFDASAADVEQRLQAAIARYASGGKPLLEMISLAEYLKRPDAQWRAVDTSGKFNLRNQHQRTDEQERLKKVGHLSRSEAISGLSTKTAASSQTTTEPKPPPVVQPPTPKTPDVKPIATLPSEAPTSSIPWSIIVVLIVAGCGLVWLLLRRRS